MLLLHCLSFCYMQQMLLPFCPSFSLLKQILLLLCLLSCYRKENIATILQFELLYGHPFFTFHLIFFTCSLYFPLFCFAAILPFKQLCLENKTCLPFSLSKPRPPQPAWNLLRNWAMSRMSDHSYQLAKRELERYLHQTWQCRKQTSTRR